MPHDMFKPWGADAGPKAVLRQSLPRLSGRDRETAESLLASRSLSPKQAALAASLTDRAKALPAPSTDGLEPIVAILTAAGTKLKWPVIRFAAGDIRFRLSLTGPQSRDPGSVSVTSDEKSFQDRAYFGRINPLGTFESGHKHAQAAAEIGAALVAFAAAPAAQARMYGQRFGRCCFCGLELTDGRSVDAGYGPICADKFGLAW
jgi:hypothetical protein